MFADFLPHSLTAVTLEVSDEMKRTDLNKITNFFEFEHHWKHLG